MGTGVLGLMSLGIVVIIGHSLLPYLVYISHGGEGKTLVPRTLIPFTPGIEIGVPWSRVS